MKTNSIKPKIEKKLNSSKDFLEIQRFPKRDHYSYDIFFKDKQIGRLQISHTSSEYGKGLIGTMARQLGISSQDLKGIEKCTFWGKDFVENSRLIVKS